MDLNLSALDVNALKLVELRNYLAKLGINANGNKNELRLKLTEAILTDSDCKYDGKNLNDSCSSTETVIDISERRCTTASNRNNKLKTKSRNGIILKLINKINYLEQTINFLAVRLTKSLKNKNKNKDKNNQPSKQKSDPTNSCSNVINKLKVSNNNKDKQIVAPKIPKRKSRTPKSKVISPKSIAAADHLQDRVSLPPTHNKRNEPLVKQREFQQVTHKPRVLMLADSHGRQATQHITNSLNDEYDVATIFKPNAKTCDVLEDVKKLFSNFTTDDYAIIMTGTNDILSNSNVSKNVYDAIKYLYNRCNLIYISVPYWYGKHSLNERIYEHNNRMFDFFKNTIKNVDCFIDINALINAGDKTKHGLHLNIMGKHKLFAHIGKIIKLQNVKLSRYCNLKTIQCNNINFQNVAAMIEIV